MTDILYAAKGGSATTSDLYLVDPTTAVTTSIGPIGFAVTGIVFDPTDGTLYGVTNTNSASNPKSLITIDPLTGAGALVGALSTGGPGRSVPDIAFRSNGQMYGYNTFDTVLATINKTTGALGDLPASVFISSTSGNALTFNAADDCYFFPKGSGGLYYLMNLTTGDPTSVGTLSDSGLSSTGAVNAAACKPDDSFWLIINNRELVTCDIATGVLTELGTLTGGTTWDALAWTAATVSPVIFADDSATVGGGAGGVRIAVAFNDTTFEEEPTWTFLTALPSVRAASYTLDKGKQDEQDQVGTTQVVINVFDRDGTLDPTNSSSEFYGLIDALLQVRIELYNPVTETWHTRFRGFISDWDYVPYPGSHVDPAGVVKGYYSVQISAVGIMEPITAIELQIGAFGDSPPAGTEGNVFFDNATFQDRITQVWGNAGIPDGWLVAFTGNVEMAESRYSPSDNVMSVIQDAVDAELPTVANAYEDRFGRLAAHGRLAEFDAPGVAAGASAGAWDFHEWKAGDERAVLASPSDTAQIREAPFNRGNGHLINSGYCTPVGIAEADKAGQLYVDTASRDVKGIRSWSKENLYISEGLLTGNTANEETFLYAKFAVENGKQPKNRFTRLTFKSMRPEDGRAAPNWDILTRCDVQDSIAVTITFAGRPADSPNFNLEPFFILGIHEQVTPLTDSYAMVTTSFDVAPRPLDDVGLATPG